MPWTIRVIRLFYRWAYTLLRLYWFVVRPDLYGGVSCVLCWNQHLLLVRHTYGSPVWTVPGGGICKGETSEAAVRREIAEEVGITLGAVHYLGEVIAIHDYVRDHIAVFAATTMRANITLDPREILEAQWFSLNALPLISENARQVLRLWQRQHAEG